MCPREGEREPGAYKKAHTGRGTEQRTKTAPGEGQAHGEKVLNLQSFLNDRLLLLPRQEDRR